MLASSPEKLRTAWRKPLNQPTPIARHLRPVSISVDSSEPNTWNEGLNANEYTPYLHDYGQHGSILEPTTADYGELEHSQPWWLHQCIK